MASTLAWSCSVIPWGEYTNKKASPPPIGEQSCAIAKSDPATTPRGTRATLEVKPDRGDRDTLFILALSGGGSRAANWSADIMLRLQEVFPDDDLLAQVDVISSVSGGSLPAAYYAISTDKPRDGRPGEANLYGRWWDRKDVDKIMRRNYVGRWFGNWFWPTNILMYWFTAYDRTDIMAQTFADGVFDTRPFGRDLKMRDLRCARPYLILNAANATRGSDDALFSFTTNQFAEIDSDLEDYKLARAVMASATFPGVFNDMTLRDFHAPPEPGGTKQKSYVHLFDGGLNDNLGLHGASSVLEHMNGHDHEKDERKDRAYSKLIVILVDAYTNRNGVDPSVADPRGFWDHIVDTNFLNATGALLFQNRESTEKDFLTKLWALDRDGQHTIFYHITFDDVAGAKLRKEVNKIGTNFEIDDENADDLAEAANEVINSKNPCLLEIKSLIEKGTKTLPGIKCPPPRQ